MSSITLPTRDLQIADYTSKDGQEMEVVRIKPNCAFDESFIEECKQAGVNKYVPRDKEGENEDVED